jgi:cystathionine beta-synthase
MSEIADATRSGALALVGDTPLFEVTKIDTGPCRLFLKLENQNPGGSIKDRIGLFMIQAAIDEGHFRDGMEFVEATAGNTGIGLALAAAAMGHKLTVFVPDKMAREKILHIQALGAKAVLTRSDVPKGHPEHYCSVAEAYAKASPDRYFIDQFNNPANPLAHEKTTAPEIFKQMDGDLDAFVCGVGSGGTLTGCGRYFRKVSPKTEIILADPLGSAMAGWVNEGKPGPDGSFRVEGVGSDCIPGVCEIEYATKAYSIPDAESFETARMLLQKEGILGGSSTGTLVAAALRYCREQTSPKRVVTFVCDSGNKYLSKMFNDFWMREQRLLDEVDSGDVTDLLIHRFDRGEMVVVTPNDTLQTAYNRMRSADVSQLPVIEDGKLVGLIDESDMIHFVSSRKDVDNRFLCPVREAMVTNLQTIPASAPPEAVVPILEEDHVAIVMDGDQFLGLVTRVDWINHLRTH